MSNRGKGTRAAAGAPLRDRDAIITEAEWAEWRRCSVRTVQRERIGGGGCRYVKLGKQRIGYRVGDCLEWIAAQTVASTSDATARSGHTR